MTPYPGVRLGEFGVQTYDSGWDDDAVWFNVGYLGDIGGPMFGFWDDGPYVVSVVSAQGQYFLSGNENWCAGGSDLTRLVNHAIASSP